MNRLKVFLGSFLAIVQLLLLVPQAALAVNPPALAVPPGLSFAQIKITGNEFLMLQNNTADPITDLSQYWLYGFNNVNPVASGVNSTLQQLPSGSLLPGQTLLLNATGGSTCGAAVTGKLGISLTDSGGYLEIVKTALVNNLLVYTGGDAVSWSSAVNSAPGMISQVPSSSADPAGAWYRYQNSLPTPPFLWQQADVDASNVCQLNVVISNVVTTGPSNPGNQLLPGLPPAATFITIVSSTGSGSGPYLPASDKGLRTPTLTEILPNPASPATDANDEFVELYNSNSATFDLSGFKIQSASLTSKTLHVYKIPAGTTVKGHGYISFTSGNTSISLNNSGGQVWLLDPFGNVLNKTDVYGKAASGSAWALGNGKWFWTGTPTPNRANTITQTSGAGAPGSTTKAPSISGVEGITTSDPHSAASGKTSSTAPQSSDTGQKLHPWIIVVIGLLALIYALYEYRNGIINKVRQFVRNRSSRRKDR